jgi:hypothetical protein
MPTPFDLLSQKLDDPDPEDDLSQMLGQDQGANLAGGPEAQPDAQPDLGGAPPVQPATPNVPGPLAALAPPAKAGKPKIKLLSPPKKKLKIRLKPHVSASPMRMTPTPKPHIKLKSGGLSGRL